MIRCEYCNAPMLSTATVCANCGREQPPFPPQLPGGGGKSYRGWAAILASIGIGLIVVGVAIFIQLVIAEFPPTPSACIYGDPSTCLTNPGEAQWVTLFGAPLYPGFGYLIFFAGFGVILLIWAVVSYNRGNKIDRINADLLRTLERNNNR